MSKEKAFLESVTEALKTGKKLTTAVDRSELVEGCSFDQPLRDLCRKVLIDLERAEEYVANSQKLVLAAKQTIWALSLDGDSVALEEALDALGVKYDITGERPE